MMTIMAVRKRTKEPLLMERNRRVETKIIDHPSLRQMDKTWKQQQIYFSGPKIITDVDWCFGNKRRLLLEKEGCDQTRQCIENRNICQIKIHLVKVISSLSFVDMMSAGLWQKAEAEELMFEVVEEKILRVLWTV